MNLMMQKIQSESKLNSDIGKWLKENGIEYLQYDLFHM